MTYEVRTVNADGTGYLVITLDDGKTVGQGFRSMPVDDAAAFDAAIAELVDSVVMRHTATAPTVAPQVLAKVGQPVTRSQPQGQAGNRRGPS